MLQLYVTVQEVDVDDHKVREFIRAEDVELEIGLSDRRAAYDFLSQVGSWLLASVFALNGGALVVLLGRDDIGWTELKAPVQLFLLGLLAAFTAGILLTYLAMSFIERAERKLDRSRLQRRPRLSSKSARLILALSACSFFLGAYICFAAGAQLVFNSVDGDASAIATPAGKVR